MVIMSFFYLYFHINKKHIRKCGVTKKNLWLQYIHPFLFNGCSIPKKNKCLKHNS